MLFSSLNLDGVSFDERPWRVAGGLLSPRVRYHVAYAARHPGSMVRSMRNYRRTRQHAEDGHGWGRRPLRAHEFRFVVHFATMEETVAEAGAAGLEVVAAYADDGSELAPSTAHTDADYVHFVCRRPALTVSRSWVNLATQRESRHGSGRLAGWPTQPDP